MTTRITRVYTRTGDRGQTGLVGGGRVAKDHRRVNAYGTVDELNSWVGVAQAELNRSKMAPRRRRMISALLLEIQQDLFDLGAQLATPSRLQTRAPQVGEREVAILERVMDQFLAELTPLPSFVLPGGGPLTATLHLCRTVCRRAERETVHLSKTARIGAAPVIYLNRLSDLFFVLARWAGKQLGEPERLWNTERRKT